MTVFPELHYTRKERIENAKSGFIFAFCVFGSITALVLFGMFLNYLIDEGIITTMFNLLTLPVTISSNIAASVTDNSDIGVYGLGFSAGIISLFFYAIFIYLTLFHWWWKPISGKDLVYFLWKSGQVIGFTLFVWVVVLYSINYWTELFVNRHPIELAEITNDGTNTFAFSVLFAALAIVSIIGWFLITFKELSLQVKGSYYRRALGIIFGVQLIGGLGNLGMFWNGSIEQDFFMAAVGFIGAVGLLAWWNGCDQAYQMAKALKEKTPQEEEFSINMPEVEIPIPERKMCSLKGMGISTCAITFIVLVILFFMYITGESSTETVSTASTNVVESSENHFAWLTSMISQFFAVIVFPLRALFGFGLSVGQSSGLPMPFEQNTAGFALSLLFAGAGLGIYVAGVCALFADKNNYIATLFKILKFWSLFFLTLGIILAATAYISTLWVSKFASLHFASANNPRHLAISVFILLVASLITCLWWSCTCPEKYQNYWTLCTRAIITPFVTLFLAMMTTITTGAWSTWFMLFLAMLITSTLLGYIYGDGIPSVLQTKEQNKEEVLSENQHITT